MNEEAQSHLAETPSLGVDNRKMGIWMLIGSEVVFFSSLIATYMINRGKSIHGPFPGEALNIPLTAINTFVLLSSSLAMVMALSRFQSGNQRGGRLFLLLTAGLGVLFLGGQATEFTLLAQQNVSLSQNLFGATFFTLTGFHGAHVLVGIIWIGLVLIQASQGKITQQNYLNVEIVGLYWHFVDIVWIIIFTLVYLI
jgi:heme/copper-type cytochrome/quinol oxidase subunit 3